MLPEGRGFREWRPAAMRAATAGVLDMLAGVGARPAIDAADWLDEDDFWDGHHPLPRGADRLSHRLADEVQRRVQP